MDNRTKGLIATIASVILCGCPGLFLCIFGGLAASGNMPFNTDFNGVSNSGTLPPTAGIVLVCLSVIFIAIPIVVGFLSLRKKPAAAPINNEPVPPAS